MRGRAPSRPTRLEQADRGGPFRQRNVGLRNVFHNEDDCPLLVSSIDGLSTLPGPAHKDHLYWPPTFPHLPTDCPVFLIKSRHTPATQHRGHFERPSDPYSSIRRKIKSVSDKYFRNIQRKNPESIENSSLEDKFDFKNLDSQLREISEKCCQLKCEAELSLSEQDLTVCQTEAQIEQDQR